MAESIIHPAQHSLAQLGRLLELASTVSGNPVEVFDSIVRIIAELYGVRIALVEKLEGERIITLSMYRDGEIYHEGQFDLAGTPCANVRERRTFCYFTSATRDFPQDQFLKDFNIDFYVGLPVISSDGEVIAIINAMHDRPIVLSENDRLFLEALASRIRLELEREHQQSEAQNVRLLLDISRNIAVIRDVDQILQLVVDHARELLAVDMAAVAVLDDSAGTTIWKAMSGMRTDTFRKVRFAPGRGTAGRAISARRTVVLEGIGERPDLPAEEFPIHTAEGISNALGVPLISGDRVMGVLIAGYRQGRSLSEQQIRFAETMGAQAAVAIENAKLFTDLAVANRLLTEADRVKSELIAELSTPVIPIWERVLLAPIIGTLTTARAETLTDTLLVRTAEDAAELIIIDITGVRGVDTEAAAHLRNTVTAVQILGARCIITGIRPAVAQTLIQLGIDFKELETCRKLSDALGVILEIKNRKSSR
jgi:GAF domain-containing protein/anti-anti-sigma regulatory factor